MCKQFRKTNGKELYLKFAKHMFKTGGVEQISYARKSPKKHTAFSVRF